MYTVKLFYFSDKKMDETTEADLFVNGENNQYEFKKKKYIERALERLSIVLKPLLHKLLKDIIFFSMYAHKM